MSFENRHIFRGKIDEKNVYDYISLDYNIQGLDGRKKEVLNILIDKNGKEFFEKYFDNYFKVAVNQYDELSEKNNVCKALENMANYLLGSEEIRADRKKDVQQYKFYVNRQEFNLRTKKEESLEGKLGYVNNKIDNDNIDNDDKIIHFLLTNSTNPKKSKKQVITAKDIHEDSYCGEVLRAYQSGKDFIDKELSCPNRFKGKRYKLTKMKSDLEYDMIYCKNHLKGVFGEKPKNLLIGYAAPSWDMFDFTNKEHMKKLIYIQNEFDPDSDLSYLLMDLETLIQDTYKNKILTEKEYTTIKLIRQGYKNIEIAKYLNVDKSRITIQVNTIISKLCKYAKKMKYES